MEEMHRTHKDTAWGWYGALADGMRSLRARNQTRTRGRATKTQARSYEWDRLSQP